VRADGSPYTKGMRRLPLQALLSLLAGLSAFLLAGGTGTRAADPPSPTTGPAARPAPSTPRVITNDDLPRHPRISVLGRAGAPAGTWIDAGDGAWMAPPPTVVYGGMASATGVTAGTVVVRAAGEDHRRRREALAEPGWSTWSGWTCGTRCGWPWCVVRKEPGEGGSTEGDAGGTVHPHLLPGMAPVEHDRGVGRGDPPGGYVGRSSRHLGPAGPVPRTIRGRPIRRHRPVTSRHRPPARRSP